ncbi:MAG: aldo/keto reductase [Chloroflexi bacterium]|nr:aldo/keto reductase [Chloroflexota bacterium]
MTHATPEGTTRYQSRLGAQADATHFTEFGGLRLSSLGLGTYLGDPDDATDEGYRDAIAQALSLGCNVFDSAINYRFQLSERAVGAVLAGTPRDEVFVSTKGGYVPFDGSPPANLNRYLDETYIRPGIARAEDFAQGGRHCMAPSYLAHQLAQSLRNLRLDAVDLYYIHNPEGQLGELSRDDFNVRLRAAFVCMEEAVAAGQIGAYGVATWNGFRTLPSARDYLSLAEIVSLARDVGGANHHFRAIQLPVNLAMTEALDHRNQLVGEPWQTVLDVARDLGIAVFASASLMQARLTRNLPGGVRRAFGSDLTDAQRALQFARSAPGVTTALAGMSQIGHVAENLRLAQRPRLSEPDFKKALAGK